MIKRIEEINQVIREMIGECNEKGNYMALIKIEQMLNEMLSYVDMSFPI